MHVILKVAITVDGYIGLYDKRLLISSSADLNSVNEIRSQVDAILIGANTLRTDNPSLLVKGSTKQPVRVVISKSAKFDFNLKLFKDNKSKVIIYHSNKNVSGFNYLEDLTIENVLKDLSRLGVQKLLVEGGAEVFKQFYELGIFNELRVSIGTMFLGQDGVSIDLNENISNGGIRLSSVKEYKGSLVHIYKSKKANAIISALN